jgi:hypothetical protein
LALGEKTYFKMPSNCSSLGKIIRYWSGAMRKWQKKFLSRGPATEVYYVEQLNTDPELVGSQPAATSARRKLQKVHLRIPATIAHIYSRRVRIITPLVKQLITDPEFKGSYSATIRIGRKRLGFWKTVTVALMVGTTIYWSGVMRKWQKTFLSRGPATVVYYVEQLNTNPELVGYSQLLLVPGENYRKFLQEYQQQ